jgi:hypothetical protein
MNRDKPSQPSDRRSHKRRECRGAIEWTFFNHTDRFSGVILNYSEAGAYIVSRRKMKPGSTILLHTGPVMIACDRIDDCFPPNATLLAEIKWVTSSAEGRGPRPCGAGIRFHY